MIAFVALWVLPGFLSEPAKMSTGGAVIECVRAVLLTPANGLLLMRHTWPGATPYWVLSAIM